MTKTKKKILNKLFGIPERKKAAGLFLGIVNKKIIIVEIAIVVFFAGFGLGAGATYLRFNDFHSEGSAVAKNYGRISEHNKNNIITSGGAVNGYTKTDRNHLEMSETFASGYNGENFRNNIFLILVIKVSMLVALISTILIISVSFLQIYKKMKKNRPAVLAVRQMAKTRRRAIKSRSVVRVAKQVVKNKKQSKKII